MILIYIKVTISLLLEFKNTYNYKLFLHRKCFFVTLYFCKYKLIINMFFNINNYNYFS